ncbi:SsgA family sporulation/cell division regulator [Kitasatospora paranensis]|uniref:SsgA family sporulation/cell division regulator n=1 Tax=Kitasatospora paranensis TaxID=258053 RepID=A0ABW2G731_9ACTN
MRIAQAGAACIPVPVPSVVPLVLRYDSEDPYAVVLDFPTAAAELSAPAAVGPEVAEGGEVSWRVSRELLWAGVRGPAGEGDFRLFPFDERLTELEFHHPLGVALALVGTADLRSFLSATADAVRPGTEHRHVHWPDTVEALLRIADS